LCKSPAKFRRFMMDAASKAELTAFEAIEVAFKAIPQQQFHKFVRVLS